MKSDFRFALRMLATHRWFAAVVIVTIALGIGINSTVFTLVNAVLFKPVPIPNGERLVAINRQNLTQPDSRGPLAWPDYLEFREHSQSFDGLEAMTRESLVISENTNPPERFPTGLITPGMFGLIQTPPVLGRGFTIADGKPGAPKVVLISDTVWRNRYDRTPDVVGRIVRLNGNPATIVGVMPEGFKFPQNEELWMPLVPTTEMESRTYRTLQLFGILKRGTSIEAAGADLAVIAQRLAKTFPDSNKESGVTVRTFHQAFNGGSIRGVFITMFFAVGFVLLIACANVAALMLGRAIARNREMVVRAAIGAARWQIVRQLLIEAVLLSVIGGALGLALSVAGVHAFDLATRDVGKPYWIQFEMDYVVFAYIAAISVVSGLVFGLAPALCASRVDLNAAMKEGAPGAGGGTGLNQLMAVLVVLQFAFTVVLLASAGLMIRGFLAAQTMNEFIPVERLFTARIDPPRGKGQRYEDRAVRMNFYDQLQQRLSNLPGSPRVAFTSSLPSLGAGLREMEIEGKPLEKPNTGLPVAFKVVTPGYLGVIGLAVTAGREFAETDGEAGKESVIVTREFAAKYLPGPTPLGQRFRFLEGRDKKPGAWLTVIGVSGDLVQRGDDLKAPPLLFLPLRQEPNAGMAIVMRTAGDPAALAMPVRAAVQGLDQDLPLFDVRTMAGALERQRWPLKIFGTLFLSFALIALLLASVGLYAVVAQATGRRTREIGIRMALGATAGRIVQLVLSRGLIQVAVGLAIGLGGALAATRVLPAQLLFRVSPQDPLVFAAVATLLVAIGLLACWLPARRAARIAPTEALRTD